MATRPISVVILYTSPILGQGLGRMLAAEPGIDVTLVEVPRTTAAEQAVDGKADVVIMERGITVDELAILRALPDALLFSVGMDAGPLWSLHREALPARPEGLIREIRRVHRHDRDEARILH